MTFARVLSVASSCHFLASLRALFTSADGSLTRRKRIWCTREVIAHKRIQADEISDGTRVPTPVICMIPLNRGLHFDLEHFWRMRSRRHTENNITRNRAARLVLCRTPDERVAGCPSLARFPCHACRGSFGEGHSRCKTGTFVEVALHEGGSAGRRVISCAS